MNFDRDAYRISRETESLFSVTEDPHNLIAFCHGPCHTRRQRGQQCIRRSRFERQVHACEDQGHRSCVGRDKCTRNPASVYRTFHGLFAPRCQRWLVHRGQPRAEAAVTSRHSSLCSRLIRRWHISSCCPACRNSGCTPCGSPRVCRRGQACTATEPRAYCHA